MVTPVGGNRVLSYLDIVCDDDTSHAEMEEALKQCVFARVKGPLPWRRITDSFWIELTMVRSLAQPGRAWIHETALLWTACKIVYSGRRGA